MGKLVNISVCGLFYLEGKIFEPDENGEDDGSKYYEFLRSHVDLENGK